MKLLLSVLLMAGAAAAQNPYGRITGRVTDAGGALVPGAQIRVANVESGVAVATASNAEGNYEALNLIPGNYRVTCELAGFKRYERGPLEVRVGDVLDVAISLQVGDLTENVTVTAESPLLDSATASIGHVIDNRRLEDLPLPGGSPFYLTQLAPGVISTNPPTHGWLPQAVDSTSNIAVSGTRIRSSEFTLDGIPSMTAGGQATYSPPPELIQEFRVQTAAFDASVGHFTGAHINMVIKSGTNTPHGSLYFSHLSRPLMTKDFFTNRSLYDTRTGPVTKDKEGSLWPPVLTNRYRATATGPVYIPKVYNGRNRTFWTYGFDLLDRVRPEASFFTVPTAAQRNGEFSQLLALGSQYQIYDPDTIRAAAGGRTSRQPLPGNILPASRMDAMAKKLLGYFPLPNAAGTNDGRQNYYDPQPRRIDFHSHTVRVDHVLSERQRIYASVSTTALDSTWQKAFHNESRGQRRARMHKGFAVDDVLTLRPDLVVNFRWGVTRWVQDDRHISMGFDLASLGFPASLTGQIDSATAAFPQIVIDGYTELGAVSGARDSTTYHTASGSATHIRGNHSLKFGGEFRALMGNTYNYGNVAPRVAFGTGWTVGPQDNSGAAPIGQGLASFLLGLPTGGYADRNASFAEASRYAGLFLHDDWKVTRKLTLNMGLRWEVDLPTTERYNRTNRGFDFTTANPVEAAARAAYAKSPIAALPADRFRALGGLQFAGIGQPRGLWDTDLNNFAPRAGFAYTLRPTTVLRAGYGIFFESLGSDRNDVQQQGFSQRTNVVPSLDNGLTFVARLANPLPDGLLNPQGAAAGLATFVGRAPSFMDPGRRNGYLQKWSFSVQQEMPNRIVVSAGYVGSRGTGMAVSEDLNAVPAQYLSRSPVRDQVTNSYLTQAVTNPFFGMPEFTGSNMSGRTVDLSQLLKPYPHFVNVNTALGTGFTWYHSLELKAEKRFSHGYTMQASYTWSKFMEAVEKLNPSDTDLHHVVSPQDRPHHIVVTAIYDLPFGRNRRWLQRGPLSAIIGGWSVNGIYQGQSGPPVNFANIAFYGNIKDIVLPRSERTVERWFNTDAGFERDSRRNLVSNIRTFPLRLTGLRSDGYNNWDLSVFKNFRIAEKLTFQLRGEAQDAFNHAMFAAPNSVPANSLFGQVSSIVGTEQRRISVAGKLSW